MHTALWEGLQPKELAVLVKIKKDRRTWPGMWA